MGIVYNENTREFHLFNESVSYIIGVLKNGQLGQLYYGKRIHERESYEHLLELWPRAMTPYVYDGEESLHWSTSSRSILRMVQAICIIRLMK